MFQKRITISLFVILYCTGILFAERFNLSIIKTTQPVNSITWNKDGSSFAYTERNNIIVRDSTGNHVIQHIYTQKPDISFLQYSHQSLQDNSEQIAALHINGDLDFRNLPSPDTILSVKTGNSSPAIMTFSNDGSHLAVGTEDGTLLVYTQFNSSAKPVCKNFGTLDIPITALTFSKDNKYLLVGAADNSITLIDVPGSKILTGYVYDSFNKVPVLMTSDSKTIIMTTDNSSIGFFDLSFNRKNFYTTFHEIISMQLSADNNYLIILTDDNVFSYYDMKIHEIKKTIPAFEQTPVTAYSFDSLCKKLVVAHQNGSLYVLDVDTVITDTDSTSGDYSTTINPESESNFDFSGNETPKPAPKPVEKKEEPKKPEYEIADELNFDEQLQKQVTPQVSKPKEPETKKETPAPEKKDEKKETPPVVVVPAETEKTTDSADKNAAAVPVVVVGTSDTKGTDPLTATPPTIIVQLPKPEEKTEAEEAEEQQKTTTTKTNVIKKTIRKITGSYDDEDFKTLFKDGHGILVDFGFHTMNDPYNLQLSLPIGYRNYDLIQPGYFGATMEMDLGFAGNNFQYKYYDSEGNLRNPMLNSIRFYVPVGLCFYPLKNSLEVYLEGSAGISLHSVWNGEFFMKSIMTKPYPAFYSNIKIGAAWDFINLSVCGSYDAIMGFSFGVEFGALINLGGSRTIGSLKWK